VKTITVADLTNKGVNRHKVRSLLEDLAKAGLVEKQKEGQKVVYAFHPLLADVPNVLTVLRPRKAESIHKLAAKTGLPTQAVEQAVSLLVDHGFAVQPFHSERFRLNVD